MFSLSTKSSEQNPFISAYLVIIRFRSRRPLKHFIDTGSQVESTASCWAVCMFSFCYCTQQHMCQQYHILTISCFYY